VFAGFTLEPFVNEWAGAWFPNTQLYPQDTTNWVALWSAACGLFGAGMILLVYIGRLIGKNIAKSRGKEAEDVVSPFETARVSSFSNALKTIALAFLIVIAIYGIVFANWGVWTVDFRLWTLQIKVFDVATMLPTALRYSLFFGIYYVLSGIANQTYRTKSLPEWASIAINAAFNSIGVLLVILIQYGTFKSTGVLWESDMALGYIVVFPVVAVLIIATIISRLLYKKTGNIWLGSLVNALLFTMITVAGTAASYAYVMG